MQVRVNNNNNNNSSTSNSYTYFNINFPFVAVGHAGSTVDAFQYQSVTANPELHSFSFEELRYNHMTRLSKLNSSSVGSRVNKRESEALLAANKLAILDALLGCLSIRNIIRKMVSYQQH